MAVEKRLIDTQVLLGLDALARLYQYHPVDQQKRIPMGKSVANFFNVERHAVSTSCWSRPVAFSSSAIRFAIWSNWVNREALLNQDLSGWMGVPDE